jgi:hypothetical protein
VKLALRGTRLWGPYMRVKTRGKGHLYSEGNGIFYSYSLHDSIDQVAEWSTRHFVIPTRGRPSGALTGSLLTANGPPRRCAGACPPGLGGHHTLTQAKRVKFSPNTSASTDSRVSSAFAASASPGTGTGSSAPPSSRWCARSPGSRRGVSR